MTISTFLRRLFYCLAFFIFSAACKKNGYPAEPPPPFEATPNLKTVTPSINEASGIADSKANSGMLWVQEDSGNPTQLFLLKKDGSLAKKIFFKAAANRDWEDIALAPGPIAGKNYLYLADIGDNNATNTAAYFYRMEEPAISADTVFKADTISFKYADGTRDAEAFLVDAATKDIFIITKRETSSRVYKLTYPYSITSINTAVFLFALPYNLVVSAAMSGDSKEIIVKTYTGLYYYPRGSAETIDQALQKNAVTLSYQQEPQGEAICFASDNSGIFTLSENPGAAIQQLQFYKRR